MGEQGTLSAAVSTFGHAVAAKLGAVAVTGSPEDQLRGPVEVLLRDLTGLVGFDPGRLTVVGESSLGDLQVRPDLAVSYADALTGFVELKAPGKGADPRRFRTEHDKAQWKKLQALPNLLYSDGGEFSLWRDGELIGRIVRLDGDVETAGADLRAPDELVGLFADFLSWAPYVPRGPRQLAELSARMCRLVRDEVRDQLDAGSSTLAHLHDDWRTTLVPGADREAFADGFAQTVTFGLLLVCARGFDFTGSIEAAARKLGQTHSLIGTALDVFTREVDERDGLLSSLATVQRVLAVVDWPTISKGDPDAWLYFYEHFLEVYDPALRKQTGSYYTPPEVVATMTRLVDVSLREYLGRRRGLADTSVTVLDPAVGTGTFLLAVLRAIAATLADLEGEHAVPDALGDALDRISGFELQLGPIAVAQLRVMAELAELGVAAAEAARVRLYVADTLDDPNVEDPRHVGMLYRPLAQSMLAANEVKRDVPVTVVLATRRTARRPPVKAAGWRAGHRERTCRRC